MLSYDVEWKSLDCPGDEIKAGSYGQGYTGVDKDECKEKCDSRSKCSFAVYGIPGEAPNWWDSRCVLRQNMNYPKNEFTPCKNSKGIQTYINKGKQPAYSIITDSLFSFQANLILSKCQFICS